MSKRDPRSRQQGLQIKALREVDLAAALELEDRERWNQTVTDWKRLLKLNPQGCFAAFHGEQLIGTVTTITYGQDLAWIGMLLVAREYRGKGIGKELMNAALEFCHRMAIATVRLDATPAGLPLYESLGFLAEDKIERWQGTASPATPYKPDSRWKTPPALYELDARAFYASRTKLLDSLIERRCAEPALHMRDGELAGYALARRGGRASYIGPLVAIDAEAAEVLLGSIVGEMNGEVCLDVRIGAQDLTAALKERGFTNQRDLTRMSLGKATPRASEMIFAIAGPELG